MVYTISQSDYYELETSLHREISRLLKRHIIIMEDQPTPKEEPAKRGRPKKVKTPLEERIDREAKNITIRKI